MGYIKMSAFKRVARLLTEYMIVGHDSNGSNIQISFADFWSQLDIEASGGAGQPIFFTGTQLPSENNTGDALVKGDWTFLPPGQTYTNISGGDPIEAPSERISFSIFNGTSWSLLDMGELPQETRESLYNKMTLPDPLSPIELKNELNRNNFDLVWGGNNITPMTVENNVGTFTVTAQNGIAMSGIVDVSAVGDKIYVKIDVKTESDDVSVYISGTPRKNMSGTGDWETISFISAAPTTPNNNLFVRDARESGWTPISLRKGLAINLTKSFGEGNEPSKEFMDSLLESLPYGWFEDAYQYVDPTATEGMTFVNRGGVMVMEEFPSISVDGKVEEGNTEAVSGGEVYDYVNYENLYEKMELPEPFPETTLTNILSNNNFNSIWGGSSYQSKGVSNNVYTWIATAYRGNIQGVFSSIIEHKYYIKLSVKSNSDKVYIDLAGSIVRSYHSGNNTFENLSIIATGVVDGQSNFRCRDERESDWTDIQVKKGVIIDLTSIFGAGNEPSIEEVNNILSDLPDLWFETNYLFKDRTSTNGSIFIIRNGEIVLEKFTDLLDRRTEKLAINVFGKNVPKNFRTKLLNGEDVEVLFVGNSLTGQINSLPSFSEEIRQHLPPGMTNDHWVFKMWNRVNLNKPVNNRVDTSFFTKIGTFSQIVDSKFNSAPDRSAEHSYSTLTFQSGDLDASTTFEINAADFKKFNIVYTKSTDGCVSEVIINSGNDLVEVSADRVNWQEANGFEVNQNTIPSGAPYTKNNAYTYGVAIHQRHRKLWFRVKDGVTSNISITYKRKSSDTVPDRFFYIWGVEMWNQQGIFFTNIGRSGRNTQYLNQNISDISDRNPDLVVFEMPVANEANKVTLSLSKSHYNTYVINGSSNLTSLKNISDDFTKFGLLTILPHGRSDDFIGNQMTVYGSGNTDEIFNKIKYTSLFENMNLLTSGYENVVNINLMDQLYNEGFARDMTLEDFLKGSIDNSTLTRDNIHLNEYGCSLWAKYLSALFQ